MAAFALGSMTVAVAAPCTMTGGVMGHAMPKCSATTGPVVWFIASAKTYFLKGSSHYGKGMGMYVCRATAVARGGHPGMSTMGGAHGSMGGSHAMPGSAMPSTMTMAPRPMSTPGGAITSPMPRTTPGLGLPNSTN
ncbi:MAG: hypothetical protein M3N49_15595, partial [Candidatus Eremiobacteraeota bacterium]|nr:hypothetical protein [Candidatus Eremiobacteraeota bacterium]